MAAKEEMKTIFREQVLVHISKCLSFALYWQLNKCARQLYNNMIFV